MTTVNTTNSLLKAKGLYDDVIHVIGDFLYGTKKDYKRMFSKSAEQIKLEPQDRLKRNYHMRVYHGMLGNTTDAKWSFADFNECRKRRSISYNQYIWENRQFAPLTVMYMVRKVREYIARIEQANRTHKRLTGYYYRKDKMIFNKTFGIDERYITNYFRIPDYYEGEISYENYGVNGIHARKTMTFPYFKTPPRDIQKKKRAVCIQLKTNYDLKQREKQRSEFKKGYILIENDFLKIEVERVANGKLYCKQTAKPLTCNHRICDRIFKRNKIMTKKMTYDIREIEPCETGQPPIRYVSFMVGIITHNQPYDTRERHERREFMLECDTGHNMCNRDY